MTDPAPSHGLFKGRKSRPIWPHLARCVVCGSQGPWESSPSRDKGIQYRVCLRCAELGLNSSIRVLPLCWEVCGPDGRSRIVYEPPSDAEYASE